MKNQTRWAMRLALTTGLTLLFLVAWLWRSQGVTPSYADPGTLYVDGATGSDDSDCSNPADPCATIGYALTQAANGDEIRVAGGTYAEGLFIDIAVRLSGGYEAAGHCGVRDDCRWRWERLSGRVLYGQRWGNTGRLYRNGGRDRSWR